jgi:predicted component of type VI protein secretion system
MTPLETKIVKNIWRFDPISLLNILAYMGYRMDDLLFCSHFSPCSQSRLVEAIEFRGTPRQVIITLNMGLLGGQSVLPNYMFKEVDNDTVDLQPFLGILTTACYGDFYWLFIQNLTTPFTWIGNLEKELCFFL